MITQENHDPGLLLQEPLSPDADLVRGIAEGDAAAECAFAERFVRPVRAMLQARLRNPELAADLQQDVMIEAICALRRGQLRDPGKLAAFVSGITRNLLNNHFRSNRREAPVELPDDLPALSFAPDRRDEEEREALVREAIQNLDPLDRAILQMTLIEGMKPGSIAERLQLSPDMVRQRKLRATRRVIEMVRARSQSAVSCHKVAGK